MFYDIICSNFYREVFLPLLMAAAKIEQKWFDAHNLLLFFMSVKNSKNGSRVRVICIWSTRQTGVWQGTVNTIGFGTLYHIRWDNRKVMCTCINTVPPHPGKTWNTGWCNPKIIPLCMFITKITSFSCIFQVLFCVDRIIDHCPACNLYRVMKAEAHTFLGKYREAMTEIEWVHVLRPVYTGDFSCNFGSNFVAISNHPRKPLAILQRFELPVVYTGDLKSLWNRSKNCR